MFIATLLALVPFVQSYSGPPEPTSAPLLIWVGSPDLSDPNKVTVEFRVEHPDCCHATTFIVPAFNPAWGVCQGVQVGTDLECYWNGGIEYLTTDYFAQGRCAIGWYGPNHGGKWWPDRYDLLNAPSDNWWKVSTSIQNLNGFHSMTYSESEGRIGYTFNDEDRHPHTPSDGVQDYAGISGGTHLASDGIDPYVYGSVQDLAVTDTTLRIRLDCQANVAFTARIIGLTAVHVHSFPILHGEIVYLR